MFGAVETGALAAAESRSELNNNLPSIVKVRLVPRSSVLEGNITKLHVEDIALSFSVK